MAEFFKSALGYLGNNLHGHQDNEFVGQNVEMGEFKLRVKKVIAEGGFAFVFVAQDIKTGKDYALKRLLSSDADKTKNIINEITSLKKVSGHPNIIQFVAAASIGREESGHGQAEFLILTELCSGGQLVDAIKGQSLTPELVLQTFYQTCSAVHHLHKQRPPMSHRDLKIENLLLSSQRKVKLCDFGSCTTLTLYPDVTWSATKRSLTEDELARCTTPMYRAPEMLDLYQNLPINEQADIWALGCILYFLCFGVHPFEDSAKLRILNANFVIPPSDIKFIDFHELIRTMLKIHPMERPNIVDVLEKLQEIAARLSINPESAINIPLQEQTNMPLQDNISNNNNNFASSDLFKLPRNPPSLHSGTNLSPPAHASAAENSGGGGGGGFSIFGQLKEGAASLMKNVKEASSKVVESVSQHAGSFDPAMVTSKSRSVNKGDMDISYLTTRMIIMSYPGDGVDHPGKNHIDDVRMYLDNRHPCSYAVYNLSGRTYKAAKFENRVSDCGWRPGRSPPFFLLLSICHNMHKWQKQFAKNVLVIHCIDGRTLSAVVGCSFLCYAQLTDNVEKAILLFSRRRTNPLLSASQKRYINYIVILANQESPTSYSPSPSLPHNRSILLHQIVIHPVPCFNKLKNGCRPYVDVYVGEERVVTTLQDYESMMAYTVVDGKILLQLNAMLTDDVIISVYHARSTIGSKVQGKVSSLKIFDIQFFCGFISPGTREMTFKLNDLDNLDSLDKYPEGFHVTLGVSVSEVEEPPSGIIKSLREGGIKRHSSPKHVVSSEMELQKLTKELNAALQIKASINTAQPTFTSTNSDDSPSPRPQSKFFVPLNVPQTGPKLKPGSRGPPPEKPPPPKILTTKQLEGLDCQGGSQQNTGEDFKEGVGPPNKREESIDFDNFSKERNLSNPSSASGLDLRDDNKNAQSDWGNLVDIGEMTVEIGRGPLDAPKFMSEEEVTSSLPADNSTFLDDLLDVGPPDPTNFELLTNCPPKGPTGGTTPSQQPCKQKSQDDLLNLFSDDSGLSEFAGTKNPFKNGSKANQESSGFRSFHSSFDPCNSITTVKPQKSSSPPHEKKEENDFLSFLDDMSKGSMNSLTIGQASLGTSSRVPAKSGSSDDLLGTWTQDNLTSSLSSIPRPSSFAASNPSSSPAFGLSTTVKEGPNRTQNRCPAPDGSFSAQQQQKDANLDPFAKFVNLNLSSKTFQQNAPSPSTASPSRQPMNVNNKPTTNNIFSTAQFSAGPRQQQQNNFSSASHRPANPSTGFSTIIGGRDDRGVKKPFGPRPVVPEDAFGDLLGGFEPTSKREPMTIKEMRKKLSEKEQEMDPDVIKVREWTEGRQKNIRALLCSLHTVLWEDENKWTEVGMHQLMTPEQVKRFYRKALLTVHPDKLNNHPEQNLASIIFVELQLAWSEFKQSGAKSLC